MQDESIVEMLWQRNECAIAELNKCYGEISTGLAMRLLNNRQDADECVNDALLAVWDSIPPQKPKYLRAFLLKIVRNTAIKRYRANTAQKRNGNTAPLDELEQYIAAPDSTQSKVNEHELTQAIERFIAMQSKQNQAIFVLRFWFFYSYGQIAVQTDLSEKLVSVRLTRLKNNLRKYLMEEGLL